MNTIMKTILVLAPAALARSTANVPFHGNVNRFVSGDWLDAMVPRHRRDEVDFVKGFRTLAVMMSYANGFGNDLESPASNSEFENEIERLENIYTNYGCYCWIDGVEAGVIGGGKTKDMSDYHCKELYRCYKCVNIDYAKNYTDVSYNVDLNVDENGQRTIDCSVNGKSDAENICECDKRFAESIAMVTDACSAGAADDEKHGPYCMEEDMRTITGIRNDNGKQGKFDSRNTCDKSFPDHSKSECCGIYPNRVPYDDKFAECCQLGSSVEDIFKFRKLPLGQCSDLGGDVVVSVKGDPSSYVSLGINAFAPGK